MEGRKQMRHVRVGPRIYKTAISTSLTLLICNMAGMLYPSTAVVVAILCMQPTVHESLKISKMRAIGTMTGSVLGLVFFWIAPGSPIMLGIGVLLILSFCNLYGWNQASSITSIIFVTILANPHATITDAIYRIVNTFIGLAVSLIVNYTIPALPVEKQSKQKIRHVLQLCLKLLIDAIQLIVDEANQDTSIANWQAEKQNEIEAAFEAAKQSIIILEKESKYIPQDSAKVSQRFDDYEFIWKIYVSVFHIVEGLTNYKILNEDYKGHLQNLVSILQEISAAAAKGFDMPGGIFAHLQREISSLDKVIDAYGEFGEDPEKAYFIELNINFIFVLKKVLYDLREMVAFGLTGGTK